MSARFRKAAAKHHKPTRKKSPVAPKKRTNDEDLKTPVTRVGDGRDHHDTISTKVLYLLVDQPLEPEDSLTLERGPQRWPWEFTTNAEPLYDTILVFLLKFEHVPDRGTLTLKQKRGEASQEVELFTEVDSRALFLDRPDFVFGPQATPSGSEFSNKRVLDYDTVKPHPFSTDDDLFSPDEGPFASLMETGS